MLDNRREEKHLEKKKKQEETRNSEINLSVQETQATRQKKKTSTL